MPSSGPSSGATRRRRRHSLQSTGRRLRKRLSRPGHIPRRPGTRRGDHRVAGQSSHAEQAIACAKAGKHVFVEKPLATSAKDAAAIVAACKAAKVKLTVGYHLRYHAGHRKVSALLADPATCPIGQIRHIAVSWTMQAKTADWRARRQARSVVEPGGSGHSQPGSGQLVVEVGGNARRAPHQTIK